MKRRSQIVTSLGVFPLIFAAAVYAAEGRPSNTAQQNRSDSHPQVVLGNYQGGNIPATFSSRRQLATIDFRKVREPQKGGAVLGLGKPADFDAVWASCPSVLFDGRIYRMWYSSFYNSHMGVGGTGMAFSTDSINSKRATNGKPVLSVGPQGASDNVQVMGPDVDFDGHLYRTWYAGMASKWGSSALEYYRIGNATSAHGIHWTRAHGGQPLFDLGPPSSVDSGEVAAPPVLRLNDKYRVSYAARSMQTQHTLCVASGRDGAHWHLANERKSVSGLRVNFAYGPTLCQIHGQFFMLYMSSLALSRGLLAATSSDGLLVKMANNGEPLLTPSEPLDFDGSSIRQASLLMVGYCLKVWYTGYRKENGGVYGWTLRVGLAILPN